MNNNNLFKFTYIFITTQVLCVILNVISTERLIEKHTERLIEKHSVHPEYGNYKKIDSIGIRCMPWDSCR